MIKYIEADVKEKKIDSVFCDVCKNEIKKDKFGHFNDYVHIEKTWGYNSAKDGVKESLDICEECFGKLKEE